MDQIQRPYDRAHLKEVLHSNEALDALLRARAWVLSHVELVLAAVLLLAASGAGGYFVLHGRAQKAREASRLLTEAQDSLLRARALPAAQAGQALRGAQERFRQLATSYQGTPQARPALLGLAASELALGQGAQAEAEYAKLDSGRKSDALGALGALGRAKALEAQGKVEEALAAYARVPEVYPGSAAEAEAREAREALAAQKKPAQPAAALKKQAGQAQ